MPFIGKTQPELSQDIVDAVTDSTRQPNADVSNGTVLRDLVDVVASQLAEAYTSLENARLNASLKNVDEMTANALSQFALNFDVLRTAAARATGTVTFQARNLPSTNVPINAGTTLRTLPQADGSVITYTTDAQVTLATTATKNPLTGYYEIDAAVTASAAGTASNIGANALVDIVTPITGIDFVTNKSPISTGTDQDEADTVATNILARTAGVNLGTAAGYRTLLSDEFEDDIDGIAVVGPFDADNLRVQYGNEVDVPIITTDATSFTAILTTNGSNTTRFVNTRPVKTVTSVVGTTNGTNYVRNTDWDFDQDTAAVYGYSTKSFDGLTWFPNRAPGPGVNLSVQGTYNAVVRNVQNFLDNKERKYITGDLLVKEAQQVGINITITVSAKSGIDRTQLATDVQSAITTALNAYELGEDVVEDDIVDLAQALDGVAAVTIPLSVLQKTTDSAAYTATLNIRQQEFARPNTITVTVS